MEIQQLSFSQWTKSGDPKITLKYAVSGSDDEEDILNYVEGNTSTTFKGLYRGDIQGELVGPDEWDVSVTYGASQSLAWPMGVGGSSVAEWSFSIDEETVHYTQSLETVASYTTGGNTATDHKEAVNVQPDGTVEGYDTTVSNMTWTETLYLSYGQWGATYLALLEQAAGAFNSTTFRIWPAGEILLRRVRGKPYGQSYVQIEFDFAKSANKSLYYVGDIIVTEKRGWDLLWIEYEPVEDTTAKTIAGRPKNVYVERVKESFDFHQLLLPDPFA